MFTPELGQAAFRIASFLVVVSLGLLLVLDRNSAEFVVTVITLLLGLIFGVVIVVVARRESH
jgi:diacylglycerol kinase